LIERRKKEEKEKEENPLALVEEADVKKMFISLV
jgi:hypothetical protein